MDGKRRFKEIGINIDEERILKEKKEKRIENSVLGEEKLKTKHLENIVSHFDKEKAISELIDHAPEKNEANPETLLNLYQKLEKAALKNSRMRAKHSDKPKKFMDSEISLSEAIKDLIDISVDPELNERLIQLGFINLSFELLSHENTDIVIEVIKLIEELTEPIYNENKLRNIIKTKGTLILINAAHEKKLFELIVGNLKRLSEDEDDSEGLYSALKIFENMIELNVELLLKLFQTTNLANFLIETMVGLNSTGIENRHFCAELLVNLIGLSPDLCNVLIKLKIFEAVSKCLEECKDLKKIGITSEDCEFVSNLLDLIATIFILKESSRKSIGPELLKKVCFYVKEKRFRSSLSALGVISSVLLNSIENCELFVDKGGLKSIFSELMRVTTIKRLKKERSSETLEHIFIVLLQCFQNLSDLRYRRLLRKFKEKELEKVDRIISAFDHIYSQMETFQKKNGISQDKRISDKPSVKRKKYLKLYGKCGYILALCATLVGLISTSGDVEIKIRISQVLSQCDASFEDVKKVLNDFSENMEGTGDGNRPVSKELVLKLLDLLNNK